MISNTLITCVKDPSEAERGHATWWNKPIVPFIPEAKDPDMGKEVHIEVTIKVNASEKCGKNNQVKLQMKKFSFGPIEDLIRWRMDLDRVISNKPVSDPKSKFDMAEMLLDDDPLATFRNFRRNVCHTIAAGELQDCLLYTSDAADE